MRVVGKTLPGATAFELAVNTKRVARYLWLLDSSLVKLSMYADGLGSGVGAQVMRGVVYTSGGVLVALGDEVVVADGQAGGWIDLPFSAYPGGVALLGGQNYDLGVIAGAATNTIRVYGDTPGGSAGQTNTDTYADGASNPFGAATSLGNDLSIFATFVSEWSPPYADESLLARLPFDVSQDQMETGSTVPLQRFQAKSGWFGTRRSPERGAFVIVDESGPLAGLVGERLRVSRSDLAGTRTVIAYCHTSSDVQHDLSLSRRAFLSLGLLNEDSIDVLVEVVA